MGNLKQTFSAVPLFLNEQGQKLLTLAVETVRDECCLNGCEHCTAKKPDPLKCRSFVCGEFVIDCEGYVSKAVA